LQKGREALQTVVCQYSDIEALNVDVAVASLYDAAKANRLEADALEGHPFDHVVGVSAQGYTNVLTSLRGKVVTIELQLRDVLAVLFFKQWSQVKGCQVREIIRVESELSDEGVVNQKSLSEVLDILVSELFELLSRVVKLSDGETAFLLGHKSLSEEW
jgi:hypothetical protein